MNQLQSENINEIACALSKAQGEFNPVSKDAKVNAGAMKYKFSTIENHWDMIRPVLAKNGLALVQTVSVVDIKSMLITTLCHSSGQWFRSYFELRPVKNDPQGMGSCLTYARRYMLSAMLGTVTSDEDDDGQKACEEPKMTMAKFCFLHHEEYPEDIKDYLAEYCLKKSKPMNDALRDYQQIDANVFKKHLALWKKMKNPDVKIHASEEEKSITEE